MLQSIKRGIAADPSDPYLHTCLVHFYTHGKYKNKLNVSYSTKLFVYMYYIITSYSDDHKKNVISMLCH